MFCPNAGGDVTVRSTLEADVLRDLNERQIDWLYESERLPYTIEAVYKPDILLHTRSGKEIHIEVKGWFRPEDRRKLKAVREAHPGKDIRLLFDNPRKKIAKGAKSTNAEWCDRNDFLWCQYVVPVEWLRE